MSPILTDHAGIKCTPYIAMFGTETKVGLASSSIPTEIIDHLESEDALLRALSVRYPLSDDQLPASLPH